jgi:hypothetical protein
MELKPKYKVISGSPVEIEQMLKLLSNDGRHPVTMGEPCPPQRNRRNLGKHTFQYRRIPDISTLR